MGVRLHAACGVRHGGCGGIGEDGVMVVAEGREKEEEVCVPAQCLQVAPNECMSGHVGLALFLIREYCLHDSRSFYTEQ